MGINLALTRGSVMLQQGGAGAWDEGKVGPIAIVKMGPTDYRMWFEGMESTFSVVKVGYATSTDGTTWTKYGSNPVFAATQVWEANEVAPDSVIWDAEAGVFKMWYHGGNNAGPRQIGLAYSTDGITWTRQNSSNPVLADGAAATWDESAVADATVLKVGPSDYRMWYLGKNASNVQAIGYATSTDGISWSKSGSNPVFQSGTAGQWDDGTIFGLRVIQRGCDRTGFHAWYTADDGTLADATATGIGYAWSADGITWVRGKNNPVLSGTTSPEEWISDPVFAMEDPVNQTMRVYFYYDDFSVSPAERSHREATVDLKPSVVTEFESVRTGTTDPHTFDVTPQGLPCGIVVTAIHGTSATDHVSTVTYGGVSLTRVQRNTDTVTEPGAAEIWFLGNNIPTGTQTVSIDLTSATTDDFQFCCYVLYANGYMETIATGGVDNDVANPSVTLAYKGRTGIAFGALYGGGAAPSSFTPNGNTTALFTEDLGAFYAYTMIQTTPGTADFAIGGTAVSDDVAFAAAAFSARVSEAPNIRRPRRTRTLTRL